MFRIHTGHGIDAYWKPVYKFHYLARVTFRGQIRQRKSVGRDPLQEFAELVQVKFGGHNQHKKVVGRVT